MQVIITGRVADSAGTLANGRIEFAQVQRIDTGEFLVTGTIATANVVVGELRALDGGVFSLPVNPEGTAVRVREILGGQTFEWWTAVPAEGSVEYRELPVVESASIPESIWGPPPWLIQAELANEEIKANLEEGREIAESLGGLAGLNAKVAEATDAAADSQSSAANASDSADRAEAAAVGIEGISESIKTEAAEHADEVAAAAALEAATTRASVTYKVASGVHYDVIEVHGKHGFKKVLAPGFLTDGSGRYPRTARLHPKALAAAHGVKTITSCEGGYNLDETWAIVQNINIAGGIAYSDFDKVVAPPSTQGAHYQALAVYRDGSMRPIQASDGKTAAQYVAEGVVETYGYGPLLVRNGADTGWYSRPEFAFFADNLSARTMIGQTATGVVKIISVHGKSSTSGIKGKQLSDLCIAEGLVNAINLDGGGSTQGVWGGTWCHPSSDDLRYRKIGTGIAITAPLANTFDTGEIPLTLMPDFEPAVPAVRPGATIRVTGRDVVVSLQTSKLASKPAITNTWDWIVRDTPFPAWMLPLLDAESRGQVASGSGGMFAASGTLGYIAVQNRLEPSAGLRAVTGSFGWSVADTEPPAA